MCQFGPCDGAHHLDALTGPPAEGPLARSGAMLPERLLPDSGPQLNGRSGRRRVLGTLASAAAVACTTQAEPASHAAPAPQESIEPSPTAEPAPTQAPTQAPTPSPAPTAVPEPGLQRLSVEGIAQPRWAADGSRILFYDQPTAGMGGTWSVDPATGSSTRERPQWGNTAANDSLLVVPRPSSRDTYVLHVPSGREWTLGTSNTTVFSPDGTMVAYAQAAAGQPGGAPPAPGSRFGGTAPAFVLTTIVVAGADGQNARSVQLPVNGSVVAWLPGTDGAANSRLLLSGRRAANEDASLWAFDVRSRSLVELARSKRLVGVLPSPDGAWVAHVAMWNADAAEDGLWLTRTDGSARRRVDLIGSYRWAFGPQGSRLLMLPHRISTSASHELWEVIPESGTARRLSAPTTLSFRVANCDWDCSPDGSQLVFVSADDRALWNITIPPGIRADEQATLPVIPAPSAVGTGGKPYRLPFATPPGPSTWYVGQWYGITTGGYRGRNSTYAQGQGIHFGIDFASPCGTEVVAIGPGRVLAVDGDYGSPPHNVVLQLDDGNQAMYGHLVERTRHVQVGQRVVPGQVLGNTGDSIAPYNCTRNPHLHLEIRKGGRSIATNPVPYFDTNWDDMSLGVWPGPRFERDLDNPKRHQFLDDQPDIRFGGPIISNFARPWPP
ncbi:MAG TPA: peptidoglycan DD-metalloendopeptidase family protein [Chloroflexota bacterium]|nr:peptidoglycan DD-metalloendopeptidase family protein [Chloroflexota bacterium]